jgi:hypothetical protein
MISRRRRRTTRPRARYERDNGPLTAEQMQAIRRLQPSPATQAEIRASRKRLKGSLVKYSQS